ncbi:RNA polymerase III RPC4-domain-containing protein [Apodospora peruviana]|uniref:RNA polymerase III RPC4-domain-containing protein n=1 Tax=Apodospora peruviana TaxID=516989 RepID=A0AAE0IIP1_9PEZI|nr:RNA polymerase III RPC4-domain-containing protein [Apodospora peruviana]
MSTPTGRPRAGRARGRGHGRGGRGRGASTASQDTTPMEVDSSNVGESTTIPSNSEVPEAAPQPSGTPGSGADTITPAPVPTPAPEPSNQTTSRVSVTPQAASTSTAKSTTANKYKPKAVRRSETERARIAEEQNRIMEAKWAEEAKLQARAARGRGRGGRGRGRGGFLMRGGGSTAAGPLSAGMSFGTPGASSYQGVGGGSYASAGSGSHSGRAGGSGADGGPDYEAAVINDGRINADALWNFTPKSDEKGRITVKGGTRHIMPLGLRRVEHQEEAVTMTTAAEIEAQDHGIVVTGKESGSNGVSVDKVQAAKADPTVNGTTDNIRIVIKEEAADADPMDIDNNPEAVYKAPDSPEQKKKIHFDSEDQKSKTLKVTGKDSEEEILSAELETMLAILGHDEQDGPNENLEGHMFLFQLPFVLPPLKNATPEAPKNPIKSEPDDDDDLFVSNAPTKGTIAQIDLTNEPDVKVKIEDDKNDENDGPAGGTGTTDIEEGGYAGTLVVRKSGKVEMLWGGNTQLDVMPGMQSDFYSQAVLLEESDARPQAGEPSGAAFSMGRIRGSFVLAPVWEEEPDWVVDAEDLVAAE